MTKELKLIFWPNKILNQKCNDIDLNMFGEALLKQLVTEMYHIMHQNGGIGLAAPQVGIPWNVFVVDLSPVKEKAEFTTPKVFINPKVVLSAETTEMDEGCLSFPEINQKVKRAKEVTIFAQDIDGKPFTEKATDLYAHVILHEYDHLQGKTLIDHMSALKRDMAKRKINKINRFSK